MTWWLDAEAALAAKHAPAKEPERDESHPAWRSASEEPDDDE